MVGHPQRWFESAFGSFPKVNIFLHGRNNGENAFMANRNTSRVDPEWIKCAMTFKVSKIVFLSENAQNLYIIITFFICKRNQTPLLRKVCFI